MSFAEDLVDLIRQEVLTHLRGYKVALPARVVKYYPDTQKVDVQPEPADRDDNEDVDAAFDEIHGVRVVWTRGGGASLTFPLKPGDRVELLVQSAALDNWHAAGGQVPQGEPRWGDLSDAVALVGLYPDSEALGAGLASATDAVLQPPTGGVLKVGKDATKGAARKNDAVKIAGLATKPGDMAQWVRTVTTFINAAAPGTLTAPTNFGVIDGASTKTLIE